MDSRKCTILYYIISLFCIVCTTGHEFYSSTDQIEYLVEKETELLDIFSYYIQAEEDRLHKLRSDLQILKLQMDPVMSNPLVSYKLMRRLKLEWEAIYTYTENSLYHVFQELLDEEFFEIPQQEDLDGAATGIIRLQEMYRLYPQNITTDPQTGRVIPLAPDDTFHLGKVAYDQDLFQHAFLWFLQTFSQLNSGQTGAITEHLVLQYLGLSAYLFGDVFHAIYFAGHLVRLDPTNARARYYLSFYKSKSLSQSSNHDIFTLDRTSSSSYQALCRGETTNVTSKRSRQLSCWYSVGGGNTWLTYAPVKVEEEWDKPSIIRYHDILSEKEMEDLKSLSRPLLERSKTTQKENDGVSNYRVSQSALLEDTYDPVVSRVTQRLSDITGLDMESSESLQVLNYGIGGHFGPHYDAGVSTKNSEGHRIATIIIYLSDVTEGGATVFPEIGVSLKPLKGSAVLWYNLLRNGELNILSLHAGCPVLHGSKWLATKWVRERGQEFRRPCSLSKTE